MRQRHDESIRAFVSRFSQEVLEIKGVEDHVAMTTLQLVITNPKLLFSVNKKEPTSYEDLLARCEKFAATNEALQFHQLYHQTEAGPSDKSKQTAQYKDLEREREGKKARRNVEENHFRRDDPIRETHKHFNHYTPLTRPITEILTLIQGDRKL
ncbi:hypothetical protein NE237_007163 [Protea cynaroides]|uniref:Retrotransposon gag domain-containing protein n=1 Tax=Protea cynaroides TaxID=273540 RepID=A0A9Q0KPK3_9MAGN|nr:hypothetical protein NE237_007163 [Protea cynaroides]